jgi:hypothetical protein
MRDTRASSFKHDGNYPMDVLNVWRQKKAYLETELAIASAHPARVCLEMPTYQASQTEIGKVSKSIT